VTDRWTDVPVANAVLNYVALQNVLLLTRQYTNFYAILFLHTGRSKATASAI